MYNNYNYNPYNRYMQQPVQQPIQPSVQPQMQPQQVIPVHQNNFLNQIPNINQRLAFYHMWA